MRLKTEFWVAAFLRRCDVEGLVAVLRRRGSAEAGSVYVKIDRLDGHAALLGPAPAGVDSADGRAFIRLHKDAWIEAADAEARIAREVGFDSDIWVVEVENRDGTAPVELVEP